MRSQASSLEEKQEVEAAQGETGPNQTLDTPFLSNTAWTACWDEDKWSSGAGNVHFYVEWHVCRARHHGIFSLEPHLGERVWVCQQFRSLEPSSAFITVVIASLLTFMCHLLRKMMKGVKFLSPPLAPAVIWPWNCCNSISVCFLLHRSPTGHQ